jgi:hypothetical protein
MHFERIPFDNIVPGPIRHDALHPDTLRRASAVWQAIGAYLPSPTFADFEMQLRRDVLPEQEVSVWERILGGFTRYRELHPDTIHAKLKQIAVASMCLVSCLDEYPGLNETEIQDLKDCFI